MAILYREVGTIGRQVEFRPLRKPRAMWRRRERRFCGQLRKCLVRLPGLPQNASECDPILCRNPPRATRFERCDPLTEQPLHAGRRLATVPDRGRRCSQTQIAAFWPRPESGKVGGGFCRETAGNGLPRLSGRSPGSDRDIPAGIAAGIPGALSPCSISRSVPESSARVCACASITSVIPAPTISNRPLPLENRHRRGISTAGQAR